MMRRETKAAAVLFALLGVAGCDAGGGGATALPGVDVLATFENGATRDAVLDALPESELEASQLVDQTQIDRGYVVDDYLIDGRRIAVLWVHDPSEGLPERGADPRSAVLPVVFVDDALDGSGWSHYDQRVVEWGLPDRWAALPAPTQPDEDMEEPGPDVRSF